MLHKTGGDLNTYKATETFVYGTYNKTGGDMSNGSDNLQSLVRKS